MGRRRDIAEGWTGSTDVELGRKTDRIGRLFAQFTEQHGPNREIAEHGKYEDFGILTDDCALDNVWVLQALCQDFLEFIKSNRYSYREDLEGADNAKRDGMIADGLQGSSIWTHGNHSGETARLRRDKSGAGDIVESAIRGMKLVWEGG